MKVQITKMTSSGAIVAGPEVTVELVQLVAGRSIQFTDSTGRQHQIGLPVEALGDPAETAEFARLMVGHAEDAVALGSGNATVIRATLVREP